MAGAPPSPPPFPGKAPWTGTEHPRSGPGGRRITNPEAGPCSGGCGTGWTPAPRSGPRPGSITAVTSKTSLSRIWAGTGLTTSTLNFCAPSSPRSPPRPIPEAGRSPPQRCSTCAPLCAPRSTSLSVKASSTATRHDTSRSAATSNPTRRCGPPPGCSSGNGPVTAHGGRGHA